MNILQKADEIVNHRSEEKDRQYGPFDLSMEYMRDIFNAMTGLNLTAEHMHYAMIAMKFARERHAHKEDNMLDAVAYLGALNNYIEKKNDNQPKSLQHLAKIFSFSTEELQAADFTKESYKESKLQRLLKDLEDILNRMQ